MAVQMMAQFHREIKNHNVNKFCFLTNFYTFNFKMFKCIGRNFSTNIKFLMANRDFNQKYFSVLYPANCTINVNKNSKEFLKPHGTDQIQLRCLSMQDIEAVSVGFYNSITSSSASKLLYDCLIQTHDITGLSWCSTIVLSAAALKLFVSFPIGIYQQYISAKLKTIRTEFTPVVEKLKQEILVKAKKERWSKKKATLVLNREARKLMNDQIVKNNCHPFKIIVLSFCQLPIWLVMTLTIKKFSQDVVTGKADSVAAALQFQVGGPFWCTNLALPDPTFIIPILISITNLILVELHTLSPHYVVNLISNITTYIFRFFTIILLCVTCIMPSGVSLFWLSSSVCSLAQNLLYMSPKLRRSFGIPKTLLDTENPYKFAIQKFKEKWF